MVKRLETRYVATWTCNDRGSTQHLTSWCDIQLASRYTRDGMTCVWIKIGCKASGTSAHCGYADIANLSTYPRKPFWNAATKTPQGSMLKIYPRPKAKRLVIGAFESLRGPRNAMHALGPHLKNSLNCAGPLPIAVLCTRPSMAMSHRVEREPM